MNKKLKTKLINNWIEYASLEKEDLSFRTYMVLFDEIPCVTQRGLIFIDKYFQELEKNFTMEQILKYSRYSRYSPPKRNNKNETGVIRLLADLKNNVIVNDDGDGTCSFLSSAKTPENVIDKYLSISESYLPKKYKKRRKGLIYILTLIGKGMKERLSFSPFKLDKFEIDVNINYNEDFQPKYAEIKKRLSNKDDNGIVILYGEPGTGKTYFLKHLCQITRKKILYIPPALVQYIVEPFFIKMLGKHRNSILLIEDADNIMRKRDMNTNIQEVSSLLNISDGILQDILKLQIVATFNTDLSKIDEAFLRKGRIIVEHKFDKLAVKRAQILSDKLGYNTTIEEPMTLADIYNQDVPEMVEKKPKKRIGYVHNGMGKNE